MKKAILILALLLSFAATAHAQKKGFTSGVWFQTSAVSLNGHGEFQAVDFVMAPGYAFNRHIFVRLHAELTVGLFDVEPVKTYETNGLIGASFGYNFLKLPETGILEGAFTIGNTLENKNWSFLYYDAAVRWNLPGKGPMRMSLGTGVRYYQSHNSRFADLCTLLCGDGFQDQLGRLPERTDFGIITRIIDSRSG